MAPTSSIQLSGTLRRPDAQHASEARTNRLVCVMDVPTPFRVHFFNVLNRALEKRGIGFEVVFMGVGHPDRYWEFDPAACQFRFSIAAGWHPAYKGNAYHVNPGLVLRVLRQPP